MDSETQPWGFVNMKQLLRGIPILAIMIAACGAVENIQSAPKLFSIDLQDTTILQGLVDFSLQNRLPIGIVLSDNPGLCHPQRKLTLKDVTAEKIVDSMLQDSGYRWSLENGVFVVKPISTSGLPNRVLQLKYSRFESMNTTMQGLGVLLSSYIQSSLEPEKGYAGNILASSESARIKPFVLENSTVEQIANHIVSRDDKGAWILRTAPQKESGNVRVEIYGYKDDAQILRKLPCSVR